MFEVRRWFTDPAYLMVVLPFGLFCAAVGYNIWTYYNSQGFILCNPNIRKDEDIVPNQVNVSEIGKKRSFCRCWRSAKLPYCDGSHVAHNKESGDNVGPLIFSLREAQAAAAAAAAVAS